MDYSINGLSDLFSCNIVGINDDGSLNIKINETLHKAKLIKSDSNTLEFLLDNKFYNVSVVESTTTEMRLLVNGNSVILKKNAKMLEILKKSLNAGDAMDSENKLACQIPGRVVKVMAEKGSSVKKDDPIVILESMKMQVAIKSHKDGKITDIKVQVGSTVNRGDTIAIIE